MRTTTMHLSPSDDTAFEILTQIWGSQNNMEVLRRALQGAVERETGMPWGLAQKEYLDHKFAAEEPAA